MKVLLAAITSLGMAIVIASSCSIDHRSDNFACETQSDCTGGRTCSDGFCVLTNVPIDAPPTGDDAVKKDAPGPGDCPGACTSCNVEAMECTIDCTKTDCGSQVVCPTGWNCNILCNQQNTCRNGVNCLNAASCKIECTGDAACRNVACGTGSCDVNCTGLMSCRSVSCGQSCACDVQCADNSSCETVICSSFQCETFEGCSSSAIGCNTCP